MIGINRRTMAVCAVTALTAGALAAPQVGSAAAKKKSHKFSEQTYAGTQAGTKIGGKLKGTFGTGTLSGKLVIPNTDVTWTLKGGTIKVHYVGTLNGSSVSGPVTFKSGTGKFKGITCKGCTAKGSLSTNVFTYTGTAVY